ncbi:MAG: hypothetical protein DHS80DRAFT_11606 [Piptocephalis tieghemiana]|nr:MAG: hypothetical protein DHS80DRAFT_11606 [Piptocephalis tieghemiana]
MNARVRRDIAARAAVANTQMTRQAYRYIIRNEALPARVRYQAQLSLAAMPRNTSPAALKNRCAETGRGRAVMRDFRLCRFQFRIKSLRGELPGVEKSTW